MLEKQKDKDVYNALKASGGLKSTHAATAKTVATLATTVNTKLVAIGTLPDAPPPPVPPVVNPTAPNPPEVDDASKRTLAVAAECLKANEALSGTGKDSIVTYIDSRMEEIEGSLVRLGEGFDAGVNLGELQADSTLLKDATGVFSEETATKSIKTALDAISTSSNALKTLMDTFKPKLHQTAPLVLTAKEKTDLEAALKAMESKVAPLKKGITDNKSLVTKSDTAWNKLEEIFKRAVSSVVLIAAVGNPAVKDAAESIMPQGVKDALNK